MMDFRPRGCLIFLTCIFVFFAPPSWGIDFKWLKLKNGIFLGRFDDLPHTGQVTGEYIGELKDGRVVPGSEFTHFWNDGAKHYHCGSWPRNCVLFDDEGNLLIKASDADEMFSFEKKRNEQRAKQIEAKSAEEFKKREEERRKRDIENCVDAPSIEDWQRCQEQKGRLYR